MIGSSNAGDGPTNTSSVPPLTVVVWLPLIRKPPCTTTWPVPARVKLRGLPKLSPTKMLAACNRPADTVTWATPPVLPIVPLLPPPKLPLVTVSVPPLIITIPVADAFIPTNRLEDRLTTPPFIARVPVLPALRPTTISGALTVPLDTMNVPSAPEATTIRLFRTGSSNGGGGPTNTSNVPLVGDGGCMVAIDAQTALHHHMTIAGDGETAGAAEIVSHQDAGRLQQATRNRHLGHAAGATQSSANSIGE